ncbi:MAG: Holliday junction resolvase RuvX [Tenuifilum sp.]|uniref:Holliday junction resolvase RuvX n=1 Tax=Tenuifilum sp. TaxID=2760880 RepID=UPI002CFCB1FE|nr:Holliday junction resolvase RuvX [Tenuifilum sp.]HOK86312.1 Holliday junction resolvase RuvX [Tenuifilum sp.]HON71251.1 Holliday junction resolvase RuvX [Tenuifilum sp.]HOU74760.1 Holliday junction resolvase RuvX [Tenuifilum sp.]HPP90639.1 Holliday junction resolvase RuvX [Tenuifilum sp.]
MGRIVALDIGRKRTGIAMTDPLRIIASPLETIPTHKVIDYLTELFLKENIDILVVGNPRQMNNTPSEAVNYIKPVINAIKKRFPEMPIELVDERFTSKMALQAMIDGGMKKKDRQEKSNVDKISAAIILQSYMEGLKYK